MTDNASGASTTNQSNTLSIVAMVLGGVALFFFPPLFGIAGIICAVVAKKKNERLANIGLIVSIAGLVLGMVLGFLIFSTMGG